MKYFPLVAMLLCLCPLTACMDSEDETAEWFCGYYNNCAKEEDTMCSFYGNCKDKDKGGSVWGNAGSDADSSHVGGMENPGNAHY